MRLGIAGIALAVSCAAAPPPQAANDGEALYRKMEAALAAAKKLTVEFTASAEGTTINGSFKRDEGNKLEMDIKGRAGVKRFTLRLSCDGTNLALVRSETPPPPVPLPDQPKLPAPKSLTANVAAALARGGAWLAQEYADGEYRAAAERLFKALPGPDKESDVAARHELRNFRLGKAEPGGTPVTYDLVRTGDALFITTITVWIEPKGFLPVKREGVISTSSSAGVKPSKWSETYSKVSTE